MTRRNLVAIYYACALALIVVGVVLWSTGHGTGDPYLTFGVVFALAPLVVTWIVRRVRRR